MKNTNTNEEITLEKYFDNVMIYITMAATAIEDAEKVNNLTIAAKTISEAMEIYPDFLEIAFGSIDNYHMFKYTLENGDSQDIKFIVSLYANDNSIPLIKNGSTEEEIFVNNYKSIIARKGEEDILEDEEDPIDEARRKTKEKSEEIDEEQEEESFFSKHRNKFIIGAGIAAAAAAIYAAVSSDKDIVIIDE